MAFATHLAGSRTADRRMRKAQAGAEGEWARKVDGGDGGGGGGGAGRMGCGARASNDGSADRESEVVEGEEEDGMRARRRRNRQGGRQSRRCWASPCIWVRVCDGRFIVALPSETEWRDPCSHLRASHHRTQNPTALDVWMHVHAREHGSAARATPHAEPSPHSSAAAAKVYLHRSPAPGLAPRLKRPPMPVPAD